ncbi:hypothetical protein AB0L85_07040 [Streptomyces sp. NPDC052051]|uniref:hypothetical protein n=1 Tax=Streptomyces sp. NPDC052051 TaxID=3154649 RepID=UPI0034223B51
MGRDDYVCPLCGHPVARAVGRRKTLGAYVPVWRPGPCRNPDCPRNTAQEHENSPARQDEEPADDRPPHRGE